MDTFKNDLVDAWTVDYHHYDEFYTTVSSYGAKISSDGTIIRITDAEVADEAPQPLPFDFFE